MKFSDVIDNFLTTQRAKNNAEATIHWYGHMLSSFSSFLAERKITGPELLRAETIETFLLAEREKGRAEKTILGRFRALKAFYKWMFTRYEFGERNPFELLQEPRVTDEPPETAERDQIAALLAVIVGETWIEQRNRLLIRLLFDTGLRVGEVARLAPSDVDLHERFVRVLRKRRRVQFVPFSKNLVYDLAMWIQYQRPPTAADLLWPASKPNGEPRETGLTISGVQQMLRKLGRKANVEGITPHTLRHGCAQDIIEKGGDLSTVQNLLGHQRIETTKIYLRFKDRRLRQLMDNLSRNTP